MDDFTAALAAADDEDSLLAAIRERIATIATRNEEIQTEIADRRSDSDALAEELAAIETELVERVDSAVHRDVTRIEDVSALPADEVPDLDPELLERAADVRDRVMANHEATDAATAALRNELREGTNELHRYRDVIADVESGTLSVAAAKERLLDAESAD